MSGKYRIIEQKTASNHKGSQAKSHRKKMPGASLSLVVVLMVLCALSVSAKMVSIKNDASMIVTSELDPTVTHPVLSAARILAVRETSIQFIDVQRLPESSWQPVTDDFRFLPTESYWLRVRLHHQGRSKNWLFTPGLWHKASLYQTFPGEGKPLISKQLSVFTPLNQRAIEHRNPFYLLPVSEQPTEIWLNLEGFRYGRDYSAQVPYLVEKDQLQKQQAELRYSQGAYLGFALGLAGFHLVLFIWSREKAYLWLVITASVSPVFFHAYYGLGMLVFWPNMPAWDEYAPVLLGGLATATYLVFGSFYLHLRQHFPKLNEGLQAAAILLVVSPLAAFYPEYDLLWIQSLTQALASLVILIAAFLLSKRGMRHAWYFVAGNLLVLCALVLWALMEGGVIREAWLPLSMGNLTQLASATQGILLALGMVDRMQSMRQEILRQELAREKLISNQARQTRRLIEAQNEALSMKNEALREIDELKDEFLARTSHELNTPLNGIIGLSEVLLDEGYQLSEQERREYLEIIVARSEHLRDLVKDLLQFAQTRKDAISLHKEPVCLRQQLKQLIGSFQPAASQKNLALSFTQPGSNESVIIEADLKRIRQVLAILVDNAIKYTDEGSVTVELYADSEKATAIVADTGIGIAVSDQQGVFDAFKQVHDRRQSRGGAGLGLSICKHLVELHHGTISLQSEPGKGSQFTLELPRKAD